MISILIPIYKWDATTLINSLVKQGNSVNVPYEIIAIDDFSNSEHDEFNFSMNQYDFVQVYRNEKNLGRSKTRNMLAEKAQYNWLLFIDSDSFVEDNFLVNYIKEIQKGGADVICGGSIYSEIPPNKDKLMLHWNFGTKRESKNAQERHELGYKGFQSNNFCINTLTYTVNQFDESFPNCEYENILYAKQLNNSGAKIIHIDNPIRNIGLKTNEEFLNKSVQSLVNLVKLLRTDKLTKEEIQQLTPYMRRKVVVKVFGKFTKNFAKTKALKKGCLFWFDVYRHTMFVEELV
ncbi:MAG: glycosyltransferase family 2 protein, partial [Bacteroidota bacterium]